MPVDPWLRVKLKDGLLESFSIDDFRDFLAETLGKGLADLHAGGTRPNIYNSVITKAYQKGWLEELIKQSIQARPHRPEFASISAKYGLNGLGPSLYTNLPISNKQFDNPIAHFESIIRGEETYVDFTDFISGLNALQTKICRIDTTNAAGNGTGFLVSENLVLTNYHVMEKVINDQVNSNDVRLVFDHRKSPDDKLKMKPTIHKLIQSNWKRAHSSYSESDKPNVSGDPSSDELDYCLLQVQNSPANDSIGKSSYSGADSRGYIEITSDHNAGKAGHPVVIAQHPEGRELRMAIGNHLGFNQPQNRTKYDADTKRGSSGSPVFNVDLKVIALHHKGDDNADEMAQTGEANQGIPIHLIAKHIQDNFDIDLS